MEAVEAATKFVSRYYPNSSVAFLAGSAIHGNTTITSDLDIVIFHEEYTSFKYSIIDFDWLIQAIILPQTHYIDFLEGDAYNGRPTLLTMCAEGIIIKDQDKLAQSSKNFAAKRLREGPNKLDKKECDDLRCEITDLLDDFVTSDNFEENMFIANELVVLSSRLLLRYNGKWTGEGKWLIRSLHQLDGDLSKTIMHALKDFYQTGAKSELIEFSTSTLDLVGGRLYYGASM